MVAVDDSMDGAPSVARLLGLHPLDRGRLLGGAGGLEAAVRRVAVCDAAERVEAAGEGDLLLVSPRTLMLGSLEADLFLRKAHGRRAAAIVMAARGEHDPVSTVHLADKLKLPLIALPLDDVGQVAHDISSHVQEPSLARAAALEEALSTIRAAGGTPDAVLEALRRTVAQRCWVTDPHGAPIAGGPLDADLAPHLRGAALRRVELDGVRYAAMPIAIESSGAASMWLVAQPRDSERAADSVTKVVLEVAAWALNTWFANERLVSERDARLRSSLLLDLQAAAEPVSSWLLSQAALVGWQLEGWHSAVYLASMTNEDPAVFLALTKELHAELEAEAIEGELVPVVDGWAFWATAADEPAPILHQSVASRWRRLVRRFGERHPELALCGGLGRPYPGPTGVGRSLAEAREACLLAVASNARGSVEHVDAFGVKRLIVGWCQSPAFVQVADALFAPMAEQDQGGELLRTLECFLDRGCSQKAAAAQLGVHRNTVALRLDRVRELLPLDLDNPDERLVAQLACRAFRLRAADATAAARAIAEHSDRGRSLALDAEASGLAS